VAIIIKKGLEVNRSSYTPEEGELISTTDQKQLFLGDGSTAGGNQVSGSLGVFDAGGVIAVSTSTLPTGFLKCNGAAVNRTTYATLFAIVGTLYGVGNGSTTFNLPDLRGEFLRGWDDGRGVDSGRSIGSYQADLFKSHRHTKDTYGPQYSGAFTGVFGLNANTSGTNTGYTGGAETRPRNISMMYIIKY